MQHARFRERGRLHGIIELERSLFSRATRGGERDFKTTALSLTRQ